MATLFTHMTSWASDPERPHSSDAMLRAASHTVTDCRMHTAHTQVYPLVVCLCSRLLHSCACSVWSKQEGDCYLQFIEVETEAWRQEATGQGPGASKWMRSEPATE